MKFIYIYIYATVLHYAVLHNKVELLNLLIKYENLDVNKYMKI